MMPISFREVIQKAVATPHTVAAELGLMTLESVFAPILACQFDQFCLDSRKIGTDDGFVLLKSSRQDAQTNLNNANRYLMSVKDSAAFVISEFDLVGLDLDGIQIPIVSVPNIRTYLGDLIAARLQLHHAVALPKIVAVTGTNGKTTVSQLIAQLCQASGISSAVMGTAGNGRLGQLIQSANTTGDVLLTHTFIHQMAQEGVQMIALEASSHGLDHSRLQCLSIILATYNNYSRDHLHSHADMASYRDAKAKLFDQSLFPTLRFGVVNLDDEPALFDYEAADFQIIGYSQQKPNADFYAKAVRPSLDCVEIEVQTSQGEMTAISPLLGLFNVDNLLASMAAFTALNPARAADLPNLITQLQGARGRMQRASSQTGAFIIDYAHTPDALKQVLSSLRRHCTGRLIAVFGCGGDRDRGKRPQMTQAGLAYADQVILTADNPRSESPSAILADMQKGLSCEDHYKIIIEPDRKNAIELAVKTAGKTDIVVIAGKGHETYQEIQGVRYDFDDLAVLGEFLQKYQK